MNVEGVAPVGEPDAEQRTELIDGKHIAVYTDMGTYEQRMKRLTAALDEPPSEVLLSVMPQRCIDGRISIQLQCKPAGFYLDGAPNWEAAKEKARELVEKNDEFHRRQRRN